MIKHIVYTSEHNECKDVISEILSKYDKNKVVKLNGNEFVAGLSFFFSECKKDTKLIVLDNVKKLDFFTDLKEIEVNRKYRSAFKIKPDLLIVYTKKL